MKRLATIFIALLVLQACEAGSMETGVIEGLVKLGPIMPVCREGVPCDGVYKGAKVVLRTPGGQVVKRATADDKGGFWMDAPTGRFEVAVDVEGPLPSCTPAQISVAARQIVHVEIDCDSGIR
ncbi:MAG: carboxypeptidase regulatory-like domain-containing protein [Alphaproteobacteria bacterium]|nr:carboxypeptidase regulatory-like domain-containing protein [Alphaproteobacteria bacterium]